MSRSASPFFDGTSNSPCCRATKGKTFIQAWHLNVIFLGVYVAIFSVLLRYWIDENSAAMSTFDSANIAIRLLDERASSWIGGAFDLDLPLAATLSDLSDQREIYITKAKRAFLAFALLNIIIATVGYCSLSVL